MSITEREQYVEVGDAGTDVVSVKVSLGAVIFEEDPGKYVSYCPALDLCSQGDTEAEAEKNIIEATEMFIEACIEDHTLEQVLTDCGFSPAARPSTKRVSARENGLPPEYKAAKRITFPAEVPMMAYG